MSERDSLHSEVDQILEMVTELQEQSTNLSSVNTQTLNNAHDNITSVINTINFVLSNSMSSLDNEKLNDNDINTTSSPVLKNTQQIGINLESGDQIVVNTTFTSSDISVATVDENGLVTRVPDTTGTTVTITVTGTIIDPIGGNEDFSTQITYTIYYPVYDIKLVTSET